MRRFPAVYRHRSSVALALLLLLSASPALAQNTQAPDPQATRFSVMLQGRPVGTELVTLSSSAEGWLISSTSSLGAPFNLETTKFQLRYTADWQPKSLSIEAMRSGQLLTLSSTVTDSSATTDMMQGGLPAKTTLAVSPRTIVLPNNFYAPYEALAARLGGAAVGAKFPIFVAPQAEITATVDRITPQRLATPAGPIELRGFELSFANPNGPLAVEVWIDAAHRLARVAIPAAALVILREDISSVSTRVETISRAGDEDVYVPSVGFSLAGVFSKPSNVTGRAPAIVLVAGSGPQDRDERVFGIPIFGQLAGALADAGFAVLRYDKRGVGRSGGRLESVTLEDYADDVANVVEWLSKRADVDANRIAVVGHSEGGAVALLAARRSKRIAALALLAAPGQTGKELTLAQQAHALDVLKEPAESRQAKIELEKRLIDAVISGKNWEGIPDDLRRQADVPWFRTWLRYDPAQAISKVDKPVLIVQGSLDTQVPVVNADRLEALSRARKGRPETYTRKVVIPGVNHLLVPAKTGEVDEYPQLAGANVSPAIPAAIVEWLKAVLPPGRK